MSKLVPAPLKAPYFGKLFQLQTDASGRGVGLCSAKWMMMANITQ